MNKIFALLVVCLFLVIGCENGKDGPMGPSGMDKLMKGSHSGKAELRDAVDISVGLRAALATAEEAVGTALAALNVAKAAEVGSGKTYANQEAKDTAVGTTKGAYDAKVVLRDAAKTAYDAEVAVATAE